MTLHLGGPCLTLWAKLFFPFFHFVFVFFLYHIFLPIGLFLFIFHTVAPL